MEIFNQQISQQGFLKTNLGTERFTIQPLKGDASDRIYFRIVQGTNSFVLMQFQKPYVSFDAFLNIQQHFQKNQVAVPQIHAHNKALGLMLLEDLGDTTLQNLTVENKNVLRFYQKAIEELIKIHHHATSNRSSCMAFQVIFDTAKFMQELIFCQKHFVEDYCRVSLTNKDKKNLQKEFMDIASRLDQNPKCINHRDFHCRNLMILSNQVKVIDFQDARMALCQYDLVSLLKDAYADMNTQTEELLVNDYLEKRGVLGQSFSKDEFMELYHIHTIQRCLKACGSFASFYNLKQNSYYLKYIPNALVYTLKALSYFPQYKILKPLLKLILKTHFEKDK